MLKAVVFDMFETLVSLYNVGHYSGRKIMKDMQLSEVQFRPSWNASERDRTCGKATFEAVIEEIMKANGCYSKELYDNIVYRRKSALRKAFGNPHPEIIPMLKALRENEIKIGLITNCYFEERDAMKENEIFDLFDVTCLSCEEGIAKPDKEIFYLCLERLGLKSEECLYIGDGGSMELETAAAIGMKTAQAVWYLKEDSDQPRQRNSMFVNLESPMDVVTYIKEL